MTLRTPPGVAHICLSLLYGGAIDCTTAVEVANPLLIVEIAIIAGTGLYLCAISRPEGLTDQRMLYVSPVRAVDNGWMDGW